MANLERLGNYLRKEDTRLARTVKKISPHEGEAYRNSWQKRAFDLGVSVPATIVTLPVAGIAAVASAIEHKANPIFEQKRRKGGSDPGHFTVYKIRTMKPNADIEKDQEAIEKFGDAGDSRISRIGRLVRKVGIDEFLQFPQIAAGQMSVVGNRAAPEDAIARMREHHPDGFEKWEKESYGGGKPAVLSLYSASAGHRKDERAKYHYDMLYAKRASLGTDIYITYKHAEQAISAVGRILPFRSNRPTTPPLELTPEAV